MSSQYVTQPGDTFSSVSRAVTGSERSALLIKQMNPHANVPLKPGTTLKIPSAGTSKKNFKPYGLDVKIDGTSVEVYDSFTCSSTIDGFRKSEFTIPNEISTRAITPPLNPLSVDIGYNGFPMLGGYITTPQPEESDVKKSLMFSADSWPYLLFGPPPVSIFPLEFIKTDLEMVASTLIAPYSIEWFFYAEVGPVFSKLKVKQGDDVMEFLSGLCKERGLIIRDDAYGSVIFDDGSASGAPVLVIDGEKRPDVTVGPAKYNQSEYYSHITGILKSKNKRKRKRLTIENPHYRGIMRPYEFEIENSDEGELETAVRTVAARMFAGVFQLPITVPGWLDKNGELLEPGKLVSARSPKDYIENFTELLIAGVTLNDEEKSKTATLTCTLPGVYSGVIPEVVPWT